MKNSQINIDIIGGLGSLTADEEKALSEYFKNKKRHVNNKVQKLTAKSKVTA